MNEEVVCLILNPISSRQKLGNLYKKEKMDEEAVCLTHNPI